MRSWFLIVVFVTACGTPEAPDPCESRLSALETRLALAAATAEPSGAPPQVPLPRSDTGIPLSGAPPLLVVSSEVVFAGRGVGGGDEIDRTAETLSSDLRSWARAHQVAAADPFPVALWAAPDVPVDRLVRLLRHAPPNVRFALLVRGAPRDAAADEPEWVEPALRSRSGRPESQRQSLEAAWTRATESCAAAAPHMPTPAPLASVGLPLGAPNIDGLMGALRSCGCVSTELAAIEAVATRALVDSQGPVLRIGPTLRFGPPIDDAPAFDSESGQSVAAFVERVAAREGPLWVRAD